MKGEEFFELERTNELNPIAKLLCSNPRVYQRADARCSLSRLDSSPMSVVGANECHTDPPLEFANTKLPMGPVPRIVTLTETPSDCHM